MVSLKGKPIHVYYEKSEVVGVTGLDQKTQRNLINVVAGGNGTSITTVNKAQLLLHLFVDEAINKKGVINIDIKEDILDTFSRKNLGDDFCQDLRSTMPQEVELQKRSGYKLSKSSLQEWKANYDEFKS